MHFAEVHRHVNSDMDGAVVAKVRPDAVLWVTVERRAERLLAPVRNLEQTCRSAPP